MPGPDGALPQPAWALLGQLSPIPGAQGAGGEKICFLQSPSRLRLAAIRSPGQALWASAEGRSRLAAWTDVWAGGQSSASVPLGDWPQ